MLDVNRTKDTYLLYKGETHLILLEIEKDSGEETIQVLNGSFVDDAWEYNGPVKDTYRNTNDMYSAIQNKLSMGDLKLEELKRKKEEMDEIMRKRSIQRGPKIENARISRSK